MQSITHNNFKGTNLIDENLPANISPYSLNVDTEKGVASKREGITSLFNSLGASGTKALHEAKFNSGDTLVFGHTTKAYELSGTEQTIAKTTTADFQAGTINSNAVISDGVSIIEYAKSQYDFSTQGEYDAWTKATAGNATAGPTTIEYLDNSIHYNFKIWGADNYTPTSYSIQAKQTIDLTNINSISFDMVATEVWYYRYPGDKFTTNLSADGVDIPLTTAGQVKTGYVSSITGTKEVIISANINMPYIDAYGASYVTYDAHINNIRFNSSLPIDLGQTPVANAITFTETEYTGQVVNIYTRGSHDNAIWSEWELKASGGAIPLARYIQVKCVIPNSLDYVTRLTKPSLSDYTLTYTNTFDSATEFDTGLTGNIIRWQNYSDKIYYVDGEEPRSYDATTVKELGVNAPVTTCTTAVGAATGLTGIYYYKVTFVDVDGVEGNPSIASSPVTVTNQKISLTSIPILTGMKRKLYRTLAGGSVYYYLTLIDDATTTTYTDSITDVTIELSSGLLQTDNFKPPKATIIYEYKTYMFYVSTSYPNRLYFSKPYGTDTTYPLASFEQVPTTNWKELPDNIVGLKAYQNKLIVTGNSFTGFFTGDIWGGTEDNTSWYLIDDIGAIRHEAIEICQSLNGSICVLGTKYGIKYFVPSEYENGLEKLPLSYDIQPLFDDGNLDNMWLKFYNSRLFVGFIYYEGTPITYNNVIVVYDFKRKVWDGPWTLNMNDATVFNGLLYGCGSNIGKVYEMLSGYNDDGADIHMIHDIKGDLGKYTGSIQRLKIQATTTSTTDDLQIGIQVDGSAQTLAIGDNTKWRKSAGSFGKQDLMERVLSVKRRGTFYGVRIEDDSTNSIDINKVIIEFEGVKE